MKQFLLGAAASGITAVVIFLTGLAGVGDSPPATPDVQQFNPCPVGWDYTSELDHIRVLQCSNDDNGWVVILNEDFTFNNGLDTKNPAGAPILDSSLVPDWR